MQLELSVLPIENLQNAEAEPNPRLRGQSGRSDRLVPEPAPSWWVVRSVYSAVLTGLRSPQSQTSRSHALEL